MLRAMIALILTLSFLSTANAQALEPHLIEARLGEHRP